MYVHPGSVAGSNATRVPWSDCIHMYVTVTCRLAFIHASECGNCTGRGIGTDVTCQ